MANLLQDRGVDIAGFFTMGSGELSQALGVAPGPAFSESQRQLALQTAHRELDTMRAHNINVVSIFDDSYPARLLQIPDAPLVLFSKGMSNLDSPRILSVVGTRRCTQRGIDITNRFVTELCQAVPGLIVVSGLASGIDITAHRAALQAGAVTVAVMAHGLQKIYPPEHRNDANEIVLNGGMVMTEYPYGTQSLRQHFLARNRIVAALSDVVLVVEAPFRSGTLSTANRAFDYGRALVAVPGRIGDEASEGCNKLIFQNKAALVTSSEDIMEIAGWEYIGRHAENPRRNLFPDLEGHAKVLYELLRDNDRVTVDVMYARTRIPVGEITMTLVEMEADGLVHRHPGNQFSLA